MNETFMIHLHCLVSQWRETGSVACGPLHILAFRAHWNSENVTEMLYALTCIPYWDVWWLLSAPVAYMSQLNYCEIADLIKKCRRVTVNTRLLTHQSPNIRPVERGLNAIKMVSASLRNPGAEPGLLTYVCI